MWMSMEGTSKNKQLRSAQSNQGGLNTFASYKKEKGELNWSVT